MLLCRVLLKAIK